jgi:hypothetical protein
MTVPLDALTQMIPHDVLIRMIPGSTWPPISQHYRSPTGKAWVPVWVPGWDCWRYVLVHAGDDWDGNMRRDGTSVVEDLDGSWWIVPAGPYTRCPAINSSPSTGELFETAEQAMAEADAYYRIY